VSWSLYLCKRFGESSGLPEETGKPGNWTIKQVAIIVAGGQDEDRTQANPAL